MNYSDKDKAIIYFDSECVLCGNFLKLILRIDRKKVFSFASLQNDYSKDQLSEEIINNADFKTVAYEEKDKVYTYSSAVLRIFRRLGFPWNIFYLFIVIPKGLRDKIYLWISNHRYSWFGKSDQCIIPDETLQKRFVHPI